MAERNAIIQELKERGDLSTLKIVGRLIDCLLQNAREANDVARGDDYLINQGKVQLCKEIKMLLPAGK